MALEPWGTVGAPDPDDMNESPILQCLAHISEQLTEISTHLEEVAEEIGYTTDPEEG